MSLIIAHRTGQKIFIIGDTKLTDSPILPDPSRLDRSQMVSDPRDGVIKITVLGPQLAIAFAGESDTANEAIKACRSLRIDQILALLKEKNIASNSNVEFIVAIGYPHFKLVEIKDGRITHDPEQSWIGSKDGFSLFQQSIFSQKEKDTENKHDYPTKAQQALRDVIESSTVPEVNGFMITVTNDTNAFQYQESVSMSVLPTTITGPGVFVIGHGTAQAGGYSVNICPYTPRPDIVPVHVLQGDIGVIYQSKDGSLLYPEILANIDATEFEEILRDRFGIPIRYHISSPIKSYLRRGQKAAAEHNLGTAIDFYKKALAEPETDLKAEINFNLALALFHSKRFQESIAYAQAALKLGGNKYWPQVHNLMLGIQQAQRQK